MGIKGFFKGAFLLTFRGTLINMAVLPLYDSLSLVIT
jgi:hypothetical protein